MTPAPILVLIVNYRTPTLTMQAVAAIAPEVRSRGDAHILVVDNGSRDGSAAQIEAAINREGIGDCCSLLTLAENLGFAAGNNAGLEHYRGTASEPHWPDLVWLLNPDTIAQPRALNS
ncbi:MAG: glycosyltransferase, partial [Sphingomonadales bacterium]